MLNELSGKRHGDSEAYVVNKYSIRTRKTTLKMEHENHELYKLNSSESTPEYKLNANVEYMRKTTGLIQTNHFSVYRKENNLTNYKELISLGTNLYWNKDFKKRYTSYKTENQISWQDAVTFVNIGMDTPRYSNISEIGIPEALDVWVDKYRKLPADFFPDDLQNIKRKYCSRSLKLRSEACEAFETMCEAAIEDGIKLTAVSAFRDYQYQEKVYFRYYTKKLPFSEYSATRDRVSARAGHSEHQTGYAVDVGCDEDSLLEETFENTEAGIWIAQNCTKYGFILRYPKDKEHITGYKYEPWHFRYLGIDLARRVYESGLTYDEFCARNLSTISDDYISLDKLYNKNSIKSEDVRAKYCTY